MTLGAKAITPLLTVPSAVGYQFEIHVSRLVLSLHEHRLLLLVTFCGGVIGFRSIYSDWNHRRSSSWISSPCLWQLVHWALSGTRVITPFIFAFCGGAFCHCAILFDHPSSSILQTPKSVAFCGGAYIFAIFSQYNNLVFRRAFFLVLAQVGAFCSGAFLHWQHWIITSGTWTLAILQLALSSLGNIGDP